MTKLIIASIQALGEVHALLMEQIGAKLKELTEVEKENNPWGARYFEIQDEIQALFKEAKEVSENMIVKPAEEKKEPQLTIKGVPWPKDKPFALLKQFKTWPMGWDTHRSAMFFETLEKLEVELKDLMEWARSEDNEARVEIYERSNPDKIIESKHYF